MNIRSIQVNNSLAGSRKKLIQSQNPRSKKKYYDLLAQNSNQQTEQSIQNQRSLDQTFDSASEEKKEGFKMEIELRFRKSEVNPSFQMPRHAESTSSLGSLMSDSSFESLERLSYAFKYDLHSQNLRNYAKLNEFFQNNEVKKAMLNESKMSGALSSSQFEKRRENETPKPLESAKKIYMNVLGLRLRTDESPNHQRPIEHKFKSGLRHNQSPPVNSNAIGGASSRSPILKIRPLGVRSPILQNTQLSPKNGITASINRLKRPLVAGFRSPKAHPAAEQISDLHNTVAGEIHGMSQLNDSAQRSNLSKGIHETPSQKKVFATIEVGTKLVPRSPLSNQNQMASALYKKTQHVLLRKLKQTPPEITLNFSSSKMIHGSTTVSKDTPTKELNALKPISIRPFVPPRTLNTLKLSGTNPSKQKANESQTMKAILPQSISVSPKRNEYLSPSNPYSVSNLRVSNSKKLDSESPTPVHLGTILKTTVMHNKSPSLFTIFLNLQGKDGEA